ncbi:MAG: Asp-tRNA(Asn)/Glu-tRNA(Gln) amidotransferase subunit GatC [Pseudomonadota bacterium]|nr:Asp-tRNA(Asn)/Glu-tRNA(Gln) amidotransferase subunit GatC [Pseudomonadota bacterium]MEC7579384.1 Asp-tRNA(Asn)/Glu-tRNA(Gln) amidotransferase subunit GatC [Pseudomonadota bacterium]
MKISEDTLKNISLLSKLNIADSMKEKISKELESILLMVDKMNEVDTEQVEPMSHPLDEAQNLREDVISKDIDRDEYIKNAPHSEDGYYLSPKVIEQE